MSYVSWFFINIKIQLWILDFSDLVRITGVNLFMITANKPLNIAILERCVIFIFVNQLLDKCPQSISVQEVGTHIKSERVETFDWGDHRKNRETTTMTRTITTMAVVSQNSRVPIHQLYISSIK
jgi:hypothetical protein